jgi:hypothetical protein
MNGPVIEGKLVRLRPPRIEDAEVMMAWFEDQDWEKARPGSV